jgi:hypothetical protein
VGASQGGSPRFRPVALKPTNSGANTYAVRFVNNDPTLDGFPVTLKDANIGAVNPYWYQKINSLSGTTNPDITLYFDNIIDNIAPLPTTIMTQWAYNAPPVQWRAITGVVIAGAASPTLSSLTKPAWISFNTENFDLAPQSIPLPVELVSFNGKCFDDHNIISWITASEINNDFFLLERSTDGEDFAEIARIPGAGTTSEWNNYSYQDYTADHRTPVYYRLSQFDYNGDYEIMKLIYVNCADPSSPGMTVSVFPNPVSDLLQIVTNQSGTSNGLLKIFNSIGQMVYSTPVAFEPGLQHFSVSLKSLAPGLYSVILSNGTADKTVKLVKAD